MRALYVFLSILLGPALLAQDAIAPPTLPEKPVTDNYHGTSLEDPYRYVENLDDPEVLSWMKAHSNQARALLDDIPGRKSLVDKFFEFDARVTSNIWDYEVTRNGRHFYEKMRPEDDYPKLYYRDSYEAEEVLIFDPETYRPEVEGNYAISRFYPDSKGN